jgi:hypothetical protein
MARKPSEWNMFVKKVYEEGKAKNSNYEFKQALVDASKRKSEMGHSASASGVKKSKTAKRSRSRRGKGKSKSMFMSLTGGKKSSRNRH